MHTLVYHTELYGKNSIAKDTTYLSYKNGEIKQAQILNIHLYHLAVIMLEGSN